MKQRSRTGFQDESADLIRIETASNKHRFYRCAIWPGQLRLDAQPDTLAARGKMQDLVRRRERKGYRRIA